MNKFFKTVAIVTVFSVCEKFLGFLYRVYLSRTIGAEGVGMYQVALSVFAFLLTVTCSGTPITVSRLMTKYKAEGKGKKVAGIITAGFCYTLLIAVPLCAVFFIAGNKLAFLFADERCVNIFLIILPGLIFTSVYSILRGVFWGNKDFLPYSIIELLEEICMIIAGILIISRAQSAYEGAFGAGVAVLISYVFSFLLATGVFFFRKNRLTNPTTEFRPLLSSSTPVTAMRTVNSLAVSLVSVIFPLRLVAVGFSESQALSLYGAAVGQAIPLLFVPTTLIGSFTLVLVPEIAENFYSGRHGALKADIEKAIKFTAFLSCIFIPVFFVCGEEIGLLIFNSIECGKYLVASSFLMLFMGLSNITTSILNSIGQEKKVLVYCTVGGGLMLLAAFFLPKFMGVYALLTGFACVYCLTTVFNLILISKTCKNRPRFIRFLVTAFLLCVPSALIGIMLEKLLLPLLGTFFTFVVCSIIVGVFIVLLFLGFGLVDFNVIIGKKKKLAPER